MWKTRETNRTASLFAWKRKTAGIIRDILSIGPWWFVRRWGFTTFLLLVSPAYDEQIREESSQLNNYPQELPLNITSYTGNTMIGAIIGASSLYEGLTWTNKAKGCWFERLIVLDLVSTNRSAAPTLWYSLGIRGTRLVNETTFGIETFFCTISPIVHSKYGRERSSLALALALENRSHRYRELSSSIEITIL